ncbi:major facilitator superfamily domain-containing protein [Podospora aff. communis PSN243]|uniref:Major facilitator superfamily domain-containing protein n=1 Tax=Podospora aff. communis PSN243 TaxID=3040156 RepID=A0AAV9GLB7_9PEZI|nr:major facilitator superfamily domain-containing protein [Podospora aff. communis PSN243]
MTMAYEKKKSKRSGQTDMELGEAIPISQDEAITRLRTKMDMHLVPVVALLYLFCFIDRANLGNARISGMDKDLKMTGFDYNIILSTFYISYILLEVPAVIICKWAGPSRFIPLTSIGFGICSVCTAFVNTVPQACAVRFLLGAFEAGMMPGIAYYLSLWYTRAELTFRLALYIVTAPLAGAFGGLLASGILKIPRIGSLTSWRMIFFVEGIVTVGIAFATIFLMAKGPALATWLNPEEKALAVSRLQAERAISPRGPLDSDVGGKLKMARNARRFLRGVYSPVTLSIGFIFLLDAVTVQAFAFFLPTIVRTIYPTSTTVQQQLYTVPPYLVGAFMMVSMSSLSWWTDRRQIFFKPSTTMVLIGYIMFLASNDPRVRYGATFLVASCFTLGPLTNAQVAANTISDTTRSAAISINCMFAHCGGLIGSWTFVDWDAPHYRIGNSVNLSTSIIILVLSTSMLLWMKADNRKRDRKEEQANEDGLAQGKVEDLDWRHPSFRWKP